MGISTAGYESPGCPASVIARCWALTNPAASRLSKIRARLVPHARPQRRIIYLCGVVRSGVSALASTSPHTCITHPGHAHVKGCYPTVTHDHMTHMTHTPPAQTPVPIPCPPSVPCLTCMCFPLSRITCMHGPVRACELTPPIRVHVRTGQHGSTAQRGAQQHVRPGRRARQDQNRGDEETPGPASCESWPPRSTSAWAGPG